MVSICISLRVNDVEHLSVCLWPFVYILWRNIDSDFLPIVLKDFIYLFSEKGKGKEKEREKHQYVIACHIGPTGEHGPQPGHVP